MLWKSLTIIFLTTKILWFLWKKLIWDISKFILDSLTNELIFKFYFAKKFCKSKVKKIAKKRLFWHFLKKYIKTLVKNYCKKPSKFRYIFRRFTSKSLVNAKIFRSQNFASMDPPLVRFYENRLFQKFNFFILNLLTEKIFDFSKNFQKIKKIKKIFQKNQIFRQFFLFFLVFKSKLRINKSNILVNFFWKFSKNPQNFWLRNF